MSFDPGNTPSLYMKFYQHVQIIIKMLKRLLQFCFISDPRIERYTEKRIIGDGSFSAVVSALDNMTGKEVVLKKAKNYKEKQDIALEYYKDISSF